MAGDDDMTDDPDVEGRVGRALSALEPVDFELVDPPAGLWTSIEAAVASDTARRPPTRHAATPMAVEYWIDADDVVVGVGRGWSDFAVANDAPELSDPPADRTLWSYIDRPEIQELWRLVVDRVRTTQADAAIQFRCDATHARRWFEMTVSPGPEGRVRFRSILVFEEERTPVALLDPHTDRDVDAEPIPLCSWCARGRHGDEWLDIEDLVNAGRLLERHTPPQVSYGICDGCRDQMAADLLVRNAAGANDAS